MGRTALTARELEIVELYHLGHSFQEVAALLGCTPGALNMRKQSIRTKMGGLFWAACVAEIIRDDLEGTTEEFRECRRCALPVRYPEGFVADANVSGGYRKICLACHRSAERRRLLEDDDAADAEFQAAIDRESKRVAAANAAMESKLVPIDWPVIRRAS